jgi:outer membrane protein
MNYKLKLVISCIFAVSLGAGANADGATLLDVYKRAQQADPQIREADATRLANREARPQAWADLLPQIDGGAQAIRTETDSIGSEPRQTNIINPATGQPFFTTGNSNQVVESKGFSATLDQVVFRWDLFAALKRANAQVAQAEVTYSAAQQDLIVRVAQRYFNVLAAQDTLDANNAAAEAFGRQLEQNEKRFEVGLIAITDVQESRAERDRATADVISAKRALATNQELLREITDQAIDMLAVPGNDMPLNSPNPQSEEQWVETSLEKNLSLAAARLNSEIAKANVSAARAGHLPSLRLSATYSDGDSDTDNTFDTTSGTSITASSTNEQEQSQLALRLTVPIFSSGGDQSRVRQAVYNHRAARERVERVSRETERAARDNYLGVSSNISRVQALKQSLESSRTALQAQEAGFEVGTRTTVDVLQSRRALYTAQTAYARSRYDYILSVIQLKQAAGILSEQDVVEISSWLTEQKTTTPIR